MSDGFVQARGSFAFDADVTSDFDAMLAGSIPDYPGMRAAVTAAALALSDARWVVDLGASRGEASAPLVDAGRKVLMVERSEPMRAVLLERFAGPIADGRVVVTDLDLRAAYPAAEADVTLLVLTLQFVPIEHRLRVLAEARRQSNALLLVEKVMASTAALNELFVGLHNQAKRDAGYSAEAIDRNLLALEGVLVPVTAAWNEDLLRSAGFGQVECLWRRGNFAAWVALP